MQGSPDSATSKGFGFLDLPQPREAGRWLVHLVQDVGIVRCGNDVENWKGTQNGKAMSIANSKSKFKVSRFVQVGLSVVDRENCCLGLLIDIPRSELEPHSIAPSITLCLTYAPTTFTVFISERFGLVGW
jgi:hypothetical protein